MDIGRAHIKEQGRPDMVFKLCFSGDACCGKTSIIFRYLNKKSKLPESDVSTIGKIDF